MPKGNVYAGGSNFHAGENEVLPNYVRRLNEVGPVDLSQADLILPEEAAAISQIIGLTDSLADKASSTFPILMSPSTPANNAVAHKQIILLNRWLRWLTLNAASGAITEIGIPNRVADVNEWVPVAEQWFNTIDQTSVFVNQWLDATGQFAAIVTPKTDPSWGQAAGPMIRHRNGGGGNLRSFQAGGAVGIAPPVGFSNANPNTGSNWFPPESWWKLVSDAGITKARLSFRWETIQPTLGGALSSRELTRIDDALTLADTYGISCILDVHNYAEYITADGAEKIDGGVVTSAHFDDLWTRISAVFNGDTRVYAYELMNEPTGLAAGAYPTAAEHWEAISQAALTAIRNAGDTTLVMVPGYDFAALSRWWTNHPDGWIVDPDTNFVYVAHNYWSSSAVSDADYDITWQEEKDAQNFAGGGGYVEVIERLPLNVQKGETTIDRENGGGDLNSVATGTLHLACFRAARTETCTTIATRCGVQASNSVMTLAAMVIYRLNADRTFSLLAQCASDTNLWKAQYTLYERDLTSPFYKKRFEIYGVGYLVLQAAGNLPRLQGIQKVAEPTQWPFTSVNVTGLAAVPDTIAYASVAVAEGKVYARVSP